MPSSLPPCVTALAHTAERFREIRFSRYHLRFQQLMREISSVRLDCGMQYLGRVWGPGYPRWALTVVESNSVQQFISALDVRGSRLWQVGMTDDIHLAVADPPACPCLQGDGLSLV